MNWILGLIFLNFASLIAYGDGASPKFWDLNDVSIIYPIPNNPAEDAAMVHPGEGGAFGPFVSRDVANLFSEMEKPIDILYPTMRLVSVRVDPCAIRPGSNCAPELRFVWQRFIPNPNPDTGIPLINTTMAFHTFHSLTAKEFLAFAQKLKRILAADSPPTRGKPLNIHPAFIRDGINGKFGQDFKKLLGEFAGTANMRRIAAIGILGGDIAFQSKDLINGKWVASVIPGTNVTVTSFNESGIKFSFDLILKPVPTNILADTAQMLQDSAKFFVSATPQRIVDVATELGRTQNHLLTRDRDKINCLVCHFSPNAERWTRLANPKLNLFNAPYRYRNPLFNLQDMSPNGWGAFAMSYQGGTMTTHTRVISDSAETAMWMNRHVK